MIINVNYQRMDVEIDLNIKQLFSLLKCDLDGHAVAVKQQVIERQQWASYQLQENDVVSVFQAIAGG